MYYAVNSPTVVGEIIDDEAVILNLQSGQYFNTLGSGAAIWAGLERGATVAKLAALLVARFDVNMVAASEAVAAFLELLDHHGLIRTGDGAPEAATAPVSATREPFIAPELGVHSDLDDMLRLDPIHDVDQVGWPIANRDR